MTQVDNLQELKMENEIWFIIGINDESELLFWSDENGWTGDIESATRYSIKDGEEETVPSIWLLTGNNLRLVWSESL